MLVFDGVSLRRGRSLVLEDVSFVINSGEKLAIVGSNGAGKSSLLGLVLGSLTPDTGEVSLPAKLTRASVAQEMRATDASALEHVLDGDVRLRAVETALAKAEAAGDGVRQSILHGDYESAGGYDASARAARLLHGLGFEQHQITMPVRGFSGGWRMRLNLAQALMCPSDVLALDEPTNHLDLDAILWLEDWLRAYRGTLLLVSHDRDFIDPVADRIAYVENASVKLYRGNYSQFERQRAEALAVQQAMYEKQQRERAHMQHFVDRFRYKATKARQAQSRLKALAKLEDIAPAHVDSPLSFELPAPARMPHTLVNVDQAAAGYGDLQVLGRVRLMLHAGDRIGLLGFNGAGKSTLIKLLAGLLQPMSGDVHHADDLAVGYFAQHQLEQLDPGLTPLETLSEAARDSGARTQRLRDFLGGFGFGGERASQSVRTLSGGEKARLTLALIAWRAPHVLLLDEPTNHLDLDMRRALTVALQTYAGAVVIVSHDRHLLRLVADNLLLVSEGSVEQYGGDLDDYARWLRQARKQDVAQVKVSAHPARDDPALRPAEDKAARRRAAAERREQLKPLRKTVSDMERKMEALQTRRRALDERLADPALYEQAEDAPRASELARLTRDSGQLARELEKAEAAWLEACEALEAGEAGEAAS